MKKGIAALLVVVGVLSIILGFCAFGADTGYHENNNTYGGDAYTGIQNAAAQTANNLVDLADLTAFGFGSILLIGGLVLVLVGINNLSMSDLSAAKNAIDNITKMTSTEAQPAPQAPAEQPTEQPVKEPAPAQTEETL